MREVFISYKSRETAPGSIDESVANELCKALEAAGITCWIAPRDIAPGMDYESAIMSAIKECSILLLVFSRFTNLSDDIFKEVANAARYKKRIIPFKIDNTEPCQRLEYHLGSLHWIIAYGNYRVKIPELERTLRNKLDKFKARTVEEDLVKPLSTDDSGISSATISFRISGVSFRMKRVEGGEFIMGASDEQGDDAWIAEKPKHRVRLSPYYISETLVTQEQWGIVMNNNPSYHNSGDSLNFPVESISWNDCQVFIRHLNQLTGRRFRLPLEAEWEFAARGGIKSKGYKYSGNNILDKVAWYGSNSCKLTHPVALKLPNELGLFDMSGNVWEWCQDWYGEYRNQNRISGPMYGSRRICRGGGFSDSATTCRVSFRNGRIPDFKCSDLGFRLVLY